MVGKPIIRVSIEREDLWEAYEVPAKFGTTIEEILRDKQLSSKMNDALYHGLAVKLVHYIKNEE